MFTLEDLGFDAYFEKQFNEYQQKDIKCGRIIEVNHEIYKIQNEFKELYGEVSGKFMFKALTRSDYPTVGDWVIMSTYDDDTKAIIHDILKRKSILQRKESTKRSESQILGSNIDYVFIIQGLDKNYNLRRLERYIILAKESKSIPIILLSKTDLCNNEDLDEIINQIKSVAFDIKIIPFSNITEYGLDQIKSIIIKGKTFCVIGSSGVGKSTLINKISNKDLLKTNEVRENDSRGRHTTTGRKLVMLDDGGILMDTPGLRELALWDNENEIEETFSEIEELAKKCYFNDCQHVNEPDCAVLKSIEDGIIDAGRLENYNKICREQAHLQATKNKRILYLEKKTVNKNIQKNLKKIHKHKGDDYN